MNQTLLIIVAVVCWGIWGVCDKGAVRYVHPVVLGMMYSVIGVVCDSVLMAAVRPSFAVPVVAWVGAGALAACTASLAYSYALRGADAGLVVSLTAAYPLVTLPLAWWLLREQFSAMRLVGAALVVAGVVALTRAS